MVILKIPQVFNFEPYPNLNDTVSEGNFCFKKKYMPSGTLTVCYVILRI